MSKVLRPLASDPKPPSKQSLAGTAMLLTDYGESMRICDKNPGEVHGIFLLLSSADSIGVYRGPCIFTSLSLYVKDTLFGILGRSVSHIE